MSYAGDLFYIDMLSNQFIRIENTNIQAEHVLRRTDECFLDDVELSDWFFNQLFEDKRSVDTWIIGGRMDTLDKPLYWIKKETDCLYLFQRMINGRNVCFDIDSVREFQNLYNFYLEHDEWEECLVEIDSRIKEIFKVV
jgi:hypothetical protein